MLSHEVAAVSLWVGGDQPDLSLAAAAAGVEAFQRRTGRYFGTAEEDFLSLLIELVGHEVGRLSLWEADKGPWDVLGEIRLAEVLGTMLGFHHAYFNDEGSYWCAEPRWADERDEVHTMAYWCDCTPEEYRERQREGNRLRAAFLSPPAEGDRRAALMQALGDGEAVLYRCSFPRSGRF